LLGLGVDFMLLTCSKLFRRQKALLPEHGEALALPTRKFFRQAGPVNQEVRLEVLQKEVLMLQENTPESFLYLEVLFPG